MVVPFNQRMGIENSKPIEDQLHEKTRVALAHFLNNLNSILFKIICNAIAQSEALRDRTSLQ